MTANPALVRYAHPKMEMVTSGYLCFSILLRLLDKNRQPQLRSIARRSLLACPHNCIFMPRLSLLPRLPRNTGRFWVPASLEWIIVNASALKAQGMVGLILDSFLGATGRDVGKVSQFVKKISALDIELYMLDQTGKLIDVSELRDVISTDSYVDILVKSLIFEDGSPLTRDRA
ncbi:MAG: hypothetical protein Q7K57_36485 [Burkholderiaceae bacterium]|nr:hypothetical protein [Burkholderiaceae bacterium]